MLIALIIFTIVIGTINNIYPIYLGYKATPPGQTYLGTIHHPDDYFYYLSQFAQGRDSNGLAVNLYTHDFPQATIVGWVNVVMGKVGYLIGLTSIQSYQMWVVLLTIGLLSSVFLLIQQSIPKSNNRRLISLISIFLFVISSPFSYPTTVDGKTTWTVYDYWFNFGTPGQRLGGVPHHLLMHILMCFLFILLIRFIKKRLTGKKVLLYSLAFASISAALASIQPLHWATIVLLSGIAGLYTVFLNVKDKKIDFQVIIPFIWPSFIIFAAGLIPAVMLSRLFSQLPFSQLPAWEFANSVNVKPLNFLLALGPVVFIAIGAVFFLRKRLLNVESFILTTYVLLSIALFFSPVSSIVKLQNVRFLSSITVAGIAFIAGFGLSVIMKWFGKAGNVLCVGVLIGIFLITLPYHHNRFIAAQKTGVGNAYIYVDNLVIEAMNYARSISDPDDIFAVMWPYHKSFPAITGRRIYYGHPLLTINSEIKGGLNYHFFSNIKSVPEQEEFLRQNNIDFVIAEPWAMQLIKVSNITPIYKNNALWIAKVISEN